MKHAVIDVGSNSMRLTVYETAGTEFQILFKEKMIAGLAGYVENEVMTHPGIDCAVAGIRHFTGILDVLGIRNCAVLATASFRNIRNTRNAKEEIDRRTGVSLQVLGGKEEAELGYVGAMHDLKWQDGVFVDIGGGSTEIVKFAAGKMEWARSYPLGSLMLYCGYVRKILPGKKARQKMKERITKELFLGECHPPVKAERIAGVGGTVRAALRLTASQFELPPGAKSFTAEQLSLICEMLFRNDKDACGIILKMAPERIHTLVPGLMILQQLVRITGAKEVAVSRYGVREGYLCRKILGENQETGYVH